MLEHPAPIPLLSQVSLPTMIPSPHNGAHALFWTEYPTSEQDVQMLALVQVLHPAAQATQPLLLSKKKPAEQLIG